MAKYPWGNEAMSLPAMVGIIVVVGILLGTLMGHVGPSAAVGDAFPSQVALRGVGLVSCAFIFMWYIFLGHQVSLKFNTTLDADIKTQAQFVADRSVANTLEQAIPFLVLLWLHALFVNPETSKTLGWIYVVTRFLYPITYGMYGKMNTAVQLSTQPNYCIIFYYLLAVVHKCSTGADLHTKVHTVSAWLMIPLMVCVAMSSGFVLIVVAKPTTAIIVGGVKREKGYVEPEEDEEEE